MTHKGSEEVIMQFELNDDGALELVDCTDAYGGRAEFDDSTKRMSSVGATKDAWDQVGFDLLYGPGDFLAFSETLKIRGHIWFDGPDRHGEYDCGFNIYEVLERTPAARGYIMRGDEPQRIRIEECPGCSEQHIVADTNTLVVAYTCNGAQYKAIIS